MKKILPLLLATTTLASPLAHAELAPEGKKAAANSSKVLQLAQALSDYNTKCGSNSLERFLIAIKRIAPKSLAPKNILTAAEEKACRDSRANLKAKWMAFTKTSSEFRRSLPPIFSNMEMFSQEKACAELPVGGGRTGMTTRHRVERVGAKDYVVQLDLGFTAKQGVDPSEVPKMRQRVIDCYDRIGFMEDYNGYRVKLQLVESDRARQLGVPHMAIELYRGIRSNSAQYDFDLECNGIVHEGLHLAGLDDEYHEQGMDCRAEADSIMANHMDYEKSPAGFFRTKETDLYYLGMPGTTAAAHFIANRTQNPQYIQVDDVACRDSGSQDERHLELEGSTMKFTQVTGYSGLVGTGLLPDVFYVPTSESDDSKPLSERPFLAKLMNVRSSPENWTCTVKPAADAKPGPAIQTIGKKIFPLRPMHVRRIVYPSCERMNAPFALCTKENYVTTAPGQVCKKDQYAVCKNEKWLD